MSGSSNESDAPRDQDQPWAASVEPRLLWASLTADAGTNVLIVDLDGRFSFANEAARQTFISGGEELMGKTWHDVLPAGAAAERLLCTRRVLATGLPLVLVGMVKGVCRCAIFRPLVLSGPPVPRVLVVCHVLVGTHHPNVRTEVHKCEVVMAEFHDFGPLSALSRRELEVLALIGEGLSTDTIAKRLSRCQKTIEWHRRSLGRKLRVRSRIELARIAILSGLVHLGIVDTRPRIGSGEENAQTCDAP